jgi:hypothetical protein
MEDNYKIKDIKGSKGTKGRKDKNKQNIYSSKHVRNQNVRNQNVRNQNVRNPIQNKTTIDTSKEKGKDKEKNE